MKSILARLVLVTAYATAIGVAKFFAMLVPKRSRRTGRLLAIGTFHNPNWFLAHIRPLASCGIEEIIVVGDGFSQDIRNVRMVTPNPLVAKVLSRSVAKFIWGFICAVRYRPDMYMGYAIFPAATSALILGRMFGRACCFQLTSGKLELEGGGYRAENRLLSSLKTHSNTVEKLACSLTRQFDLIAVRGSQAERYVRDFGFKGRVATITGSVAVPDTILPLEERDIDMVYVARLTRRKRPDRFVRVVEQVARVVPHVRAVIVGDGPEQQALEKQIGELDVGENIELLGLRHDVPAIVARSKTFVLTSRWEGLSIALLEAMMAGTVPVASDVGDLADVVRNGETGYLFDQDDIDSFADAVIGALGDREKWSRISEEARRTAVAKSSFESICGQWRETLSDDVLVKGD